MLCEEREKEGGLTANGDGVMAIDEGGKGVEVLHWAKDGCVDGEELGTKGGGENK